MKFLKSGIIFLLALVVLAACKDDDNGEVVDTTPPTISGIAYDEAVAPGGELDLDFILEDNIALGEVRIDIHDDFDDHTHEGGRIMAVPFETTIILDEMRGETRYEAHIHIDIPENAATGPYHLQINFTDAAGNEGDFYVGDFEISDPAISPFINITNFGPDEDLEPTEEEDGRLILRLEGSIESRTEGGLDEVHITVSEEHDHGARMMDEVLYDHEWDLHGEVDTFDLSEIDPLIDLTDAEPGHYDLRIMVRDVAGNVSIVTREVDID